MNNTFYALQTQDGRYVALTGPLTHLTDEPRDAMTWLDEHKAKNAAFILRNDFPEKLYPVQVTR